MFSGETESDAIKRATLLVENMLQRPDQLQKVEQYKRRVQRKKLSVDAMLKTAMQSQLDGVRAGLGQLQNALNSLKEIKSNLNDIEKSMVYVPELNQTLQSCREEYLKHSQYAAAVENLKHIFTVPDSIEKTRQYIADGKLLNAHQCITDLESSRDDLLYELHKLPNQNPNETRMLKECFANLQPLSDELGKQLWVILQRTLNTVRKEPTQVVTALRIIEREERADQYALTRQKGTNFLPLGRPKEWRKRAFEVLESVVSNRIEGNQFEDRDSNKNWLIRHLEVIRILLLEDFKVIKSQCIPCFPPKYDILNSYLDMYHRNLSSHLVESVESGLQDNEIVTLLSWVTNTYKSSDLLGNAALGINVEKMPPLLNEDVMIKLKGEYLENVKKNYEDWTSKALELEEKEWVRAEPPIQDAECRYKTELSNLIHDMIKQNLDVAATISFDIQSKVLIISLEQIRIFAQKYERAIARFKSDYFNDRSKIAYFTCYMIAICNSTQSIMDVMVGVKENHWKPGNLTEVDRLVATNFEALSKAYQRLRETVCDFLLEEALMDLQEQFNALVTPKWLTDNEPIDTICLTLKDYFQDYNHLHPKNLEHVLGVAFTTVGSRYITAIMQRRLNLKTETDRRTAGNRIVRDADKIQAIFDGVSSEISRFDSPCDAIKYLADVLKVSDHEFLSLEVHRLLKRYPDVSSDHLSCILLLRGDIGRFDVRQRVAESLDEIKNQRTTHTSTVFSHVHVQSSIFT